MYIAWAVPEKMELLAVDNTELTNTDIVGMIWVKFPTETPVTLGDRSVP